jgi:polyhydroxyalkanoate synthase
LLKEDESLGNEVFRAINRIREALSAKVTGGLSPAALALALFDWSIHLAAAPGKQTELIDKAVRKTARLLTYMSAASLHPGRLLCIEPLPGDYRFRAEGWQKQPFSSWAQAFLLCQQWWHNVTHEVPGVTPHHEDVLSVAARQSLDMLSPSNNAFANPEVIERTWKTGGTNFTRGFQN